MAKQVWQSNDGTAFDTELEATAWDSFLGYEAWLRAKIERLLNADDISDIRNLAMSLWSSSEFTVIDTRNKAEEAKHAPEAR